MTPRSYASETNPAKGRRHTDIDFTLTPQEVAEGTAQSKTRCALANAGTLPVAARFPHMSGLEIKLDNSGGGYPVPWAAWSYQENGKTRTVTAVVEPQPQAVHYLEINDLYQGAREAQRMPAAGVPFRFTDIISRTKDKRTSHERRERYKEQKEQQKEKPAAPASDMEPETVEVSFTATRPSSGRKTPRRPRRTSSRFGIR